jgi:hypothetical protein
MSEKPSSSDTRVQATNDDSIVSKRILVILMIRTDC